MRETMTTSHPDAFTILRFVAGELDEIGVRRMERHVEQCRRCRRRLHEIEWLDRGLKEHRDEAFSGEAGDGSLPASDPFSTRPEAAIRRASRFGLSDPALATRWAEAAREAGPLRDRLLSSAPPDLEPLLAGLSLDGLVERYGLGFALDEAPLRISQGPVRFRPLAALSLQRLQRERVVPFRDLEAAQVTESEFVFPLVELAARAHLLEGIICNWTGEYDRGALSFLQAWAGFAEGAGGDLAFATVEMHESQRRSFAGDAVGGLALAVRARHTFEELGSVGNAARALMAAGIALSGLDRDEEAIENFRLAAGSFATAELWRPYVGAVSSLGTSLTLLGRLAEARREFARALKLTSQGDRPASHAAIRHNLGTVLFRGTSYAKAARSFQAAAELYDRLELLSDAAINRLHLAECLARIGRTDAAVDCILDIESRLAGTPDLDPAVLRELSRQLSGDRPDFDLVRDLRERLESAIRSSERRSG